MNQPGNKQSDPEPQVLFGPAIAPESGLSEWLAARHNDGAVVQLPIAVGSIDGDDARLAVQSEGVRLAVRLDDSRLGIALADRWRTSPVAWLEGTWNASTAPPTFAVARYLRAVPEDERRRPMHARRVVPSGADAALVAALHRLGEECSAAEKDAASTCLWRGGVASIPLLIASLDDGRPFARRDSVNRTNLPAHERPAPVYVVRTVGTHCDELLHRIVTPPPSRHFDHRGKVLGSPALSIADWSSFWHKRRTRTLAEIHAELTSAVDAYWAAGGTPQRVD